MVEDYRNQSDRDLANNAKKKLAVGIAAVITLLIFVGWIFYFSDTFKDGLKQNDEQVALLEELKQNTGESWSDIKKAFGEVGEKIETSKEFFENGQATSTATTTLEMEGNFSTTTATTTEETPKENYSNNETQ